MNQVLATEASFIDVPENRVFDQAYCIRDL